MENSKIPKISVLIPVYNGEKYLPETLNSLKKQTFKDFEVVLIDDFSNDASKEIINNIMENDNRFILVEREHKGGNAAKGIEYGLPYLKGEFFFFMSQDDFIDENMFEKLIEKQKQTGADIVIPNCHFYYGNADMETVSKYPLNGDYNKTMSPKEAFYLSLRWKISGFHLRNMELVKKIGIVAEYFNSCEYFGRVCLLNANKIAFCNSNFYYRQNNKDAITAKPSYYMIDIFKTDILLYKKLIEHHFSCFKIFKRLKELISSIRYWAKFYNDNSENFNNKQREYVKNMLCECKNDLYTLCIQRCDFFNLYRLNKIVREVYIDK